MAGKFISYSIIKINNILGDYFNTLNMAKVEGRFCDIVHLTKFFTYFGVEKLAEVLHDQNV